MKKEGRYYVKSLEEDFSTKTLLGKKKVICQKIQEIVKTKTIKPNTLSFGTQKRLACTIINKNYTKTYRPHGIIFQTNEKPEQVLPFDLVLLSATDNIIVHYYRIKDNLHIYYRHKLITGFEKFIFKNFESMMNKISSPKIAWKLVNEFRKNHGYKELPISKYRLVEYNEVIFHKPIKIIPIAIYGYRKETKIIAKELGLPYYISAKDFYQKIASQE